MSMIAHSSGAAARGLPVFLPYTEATADADTFVCAFDGGSSANETGAGLGLAGADLVFPQGGGVAGASGGYRALTGAQSFTCTAAFLAAFLNQPEWTLVRKIKAPSSGVGYLEYISGTVTPVFYGMYCNTEARFVGQTGGMAPDLGLAYTPGAEYYLANWYKGGALHSGYKLVSEGFPTMWDSFAVGRRSVITGFPLYSSEAWASLRYIVGYPASSQTAAHSIGLIVASKIGLTMAP